MRLPIDGTNGQIAKLEGEVEALFDLTVRAYEAKHDENAWAGRSPIPFQFLFGKLPTFGEPTP